MEEKDIEKMVEKAVEKETKELKATIESQKNELEELKNPKNPDASIKCTKCDATLKEEQKFCSSCGTEKGNPEPEEDPVIKEMKETIASQKSQIEVLNNKLGIEPPKKSIDGQDGEDETNEAAYKGRDDRDAFGCKIKE